MYNKYKIQQIMKKEEFREKQEELIQTYIKESEVIGSMWLNWTQVVNSGTNKPESEWIEIFKVISVELENDTLELVPEITEFGSIAKDYKMDEDEEGPEYVIELREHDKNSLSRNGLYLSKESGDIRIDDTDYNKIIDILYGGDSDRSNEQIFNEAIEYVSRCKFEPHIC